MSDVLGCAFVMLKGDGAESELVGLGGGPMNGGWTRDSPLRLDDERGGRLPRSLSEEVLGG